MLIQGKSDGKRKVRAENLLVFFLVFKKGESERDELPVGQGVGFCPLLEEVYTALRCVCLQCLNAGSAKEGLEGWKKEEDGDSVAAKM